MSGANHHSPSAIEGPNALAPDADIIVIGAGPAGMSAAIELAAAKLRVIVLDMQPTPGGQIFRSIEANLQSRNSIQELLTALGPAYRAGEKLVTRFRKTEGIDYRPGTTVWELRVDGTVGWLRGAEAGYLRAPHVVLASGAMERPTPFPGWTLPGVMTAGAVQTLIKAGRLKPEGRIVLAGTGPLIFLLADQLRRLGVKPVLIARTDDLRGKFAALTKLNTTAISAALKGLGWLLQLKLAGVPMSLGVYGLRALGDDRIKAVQITVKGRELHLPCDLLVVHDGIVPAIDLAHGAGLALEWLENDKCWRPKTSDDGKTELPPGPGLIYGPSRIRISGDARKIGGADAAIAHGLHVARSILANFGAAPTTDDLDRSAEAVHRTLAARPFIDSAFPIGLAAQLPGDETIVCRCEEITAGELRAAIRAGERDMNVIRGLHRCGMGPCQGRNCAATLARLIQEVHPKLPGYPAPFRGRPPVRPIPLGALANLSGVDPELAKVIWLEDLPQISSGGERNA